SVQISYYIQGLYGTLYIDESNSDKTAFVYHHIATILLQFIGYRLGLIKGGVMLEFMHDCNDVLLHLAKIFNYLHHSNVMLVTRICMYSYFIFYSALYNAYDYFPVDMPFSVTFLFLLCSIAFLNIYWMILIFKVFYKILFDRSNAKDIR
ncbi:hypothetical protein MXB_1918, partial [Myxobolus squamalis]